jgi:hypothetical protein
MRRAIDIVERSYGPEHPQTKTFRKNLEVLLAEKERADGGPEHPEQSVAPPRTAELISLRGRKNSR